MRIAVLGASGNVGTQVLQRLAGTSGIDSVVGLSRRPPDAGAAAVAPATSWVTVDIGDPDSGPALAAALRNVDVVVHLAWLIQPSRNLAALEATNVGGTERVLRATAAAGVGAVVVASSIGAYSAGPKDRRVDESWPTGGIPSSTYSRQKARVERMLDDFERTNPAIRVVRCRPGLIFQRRSSSEIERYFLGPLLPVSLLRPALIPVVPDVDRLVVQAVHAADVAAAIATASTRPVRGAFNLAAEPPVDAAMLAEIFAARRVGVPARLLRGAMDLSWRLHLQPTPAGWLDLALGVPLMDSTRAQTELDWSPTYDAQRAVTEVIEGMRSGAGADTPPLQPLAGPAKRVLTAVRGLAVGPVRDG